MSVAWKRLQFCDAEFRRLCLGEHVTYARLPGVFEYTIDFVTEGPEGGPSASATLLFASREALEAAFHIPEPKEDLMRTREQFASRVQVMIVEEKEIIP